MQSRLGELVGNFYNHYTFKLTGKSSSFDTFQLINENSVIPLLSWFFQASHSYFTCIKHIRGGIFPTSSCSHKLKLRSIMPNFLPLTKSLAICI
jgi:hypothetical protein